MIIGRHNFFFNLMDKNCLLLDLEQMKISLSTRTKSSQEPTLFLPGTQILGYCVFKAGYSRHSRQGTEAQEVSRPRSQQLLSAGVDKEDSKRDRSLLATDFPSLPENKNVPENKTNKQKNISCFNMHFSHHQHEHLLQCLLANSISSWVSCHLFIGFFPS